MHPGFVRDRHGLGPIDNHREWRTNVGRCDLGRACTLGAQTAWLRVRTQPSVVMPVWLEREKRRVVLQAGRCPPRRPAARAPPVLEWNGAPGRAPLRVAGGAAASDRPRRALRRLRTLLPSHCVDQVRTEEGGRSRHLEVQDRRRGQRCCAFRTSPRQRLPSKPHSSLSTRTKEVSTLAAELAPELVVRGHDHGNVRRLGRRPRTEPGRSRATNVHRFRYRSTSGRVLDRYRQSA